jgi:protein gp37
MADGTKISWTSTTWNPLVGCTPVSEGCDNCYAARVSAGPRLSRLPLYAGLAPGGVFSGEVRLAPDRLAQPLHWKRPRFVFVNSMSDLFHEAVPDEYIARVFAVMAATPQHTYQILTKRHGRMRSLLRDWCRCGGGHTPGVHFRSAMSWAATPHNPSYVPGLTDTYHTAAWPLPNVWIGVSVENQKWADVRIPALTDTPAAVRWLSCEPLLGPVNLGGLPTYARIGWVVAGGETQTGARRADPEWFERIQQDCAEAGVPYHFKQTGSVLAREWGLKSRAGSDPAEWPKPYPREYPKTAGRGL